MNKSTKVILTLAILAATIRPFMPQRHGFTASMSYEAIAHIVVGMLIAGWMLSERKRVYWITLILITTIEVLCGMRP
jgi:hypothetical protein